MLRNIFISALLGISVLSASAFSLTLLVQPNTMTNLLTPNIGPVTVNYALLTSTTNTANLLFVDANTNSLVYTNPAYSNIVNYGTNYINTWTNFYGGVQSTTNIALITVSNTVPASTNYFPQLLSLSSAAAGSASYSTLNSVFNNGVWVTNTSTNSVTVTISGIAGTR